MAACVLERTEILVTHDVLMMFDRTRGLSSLDIKSSRELSLILVRLAIKRTIVRRTETYYTSIDNGLKS